MKNFLFLIIAILPVLGLSQTFSASNEQGQLIAYKILSPTTLSVERSSYKDTEYVIPEKVEYNGVLYTVTEIGDKAFYEKDHITKIQVPNTIVRIGKQAFEDVKMTEFNFPDSLKVICSSAFWSVPISVIELNEGLEEIGEDAFKMVQTGFSNKATREFSYDYLYLPSTLKKVGKGFIGLTSGFVVIYFNGTLDGTLPKFISLANCTKFGINKECIEGYYHQKLLEK